MEKETMVATVPQAEIVDEQQLSRDEIGRASCRERV